MCVIIHQPVGAHLKKEDARILWDTNPDGGGFAYIDNSGQIVGFKSMDFEPFWRKFETTRSQNPQRDYLLHFRIATHGEVCLDNVHPFWVGEDKDTVMAHNGIIHGVPDYKDDRSDTRVFIDEVLPELPPDWLDKPYLVDMVEDWIGWSKLMFLTTSEALSENVYILNKDRGVEYHGLWLSNDYGLFRQKKKGFTSRSTGTIVRTAGGDWVPYTETSQAWDDYEKVANQVAKERLITDEELDAAKELIVHIREASWLTKPIAYNELDMDWQCFGCDETVDEQTGECACWEKVCLDCEKMAAECNCHGGWSNNLVHFDNMETETKGRVVIKMQEEVDAMEVPF